MSSELPRVLDPGRGELLLYPSLFAAEAPSWYRALRDQIPWRQESARLFGRCQPLPRLSAWCAGPGQRYRYSGICHEPMPWPAALQAALAAVQRVLAMNFNSALLSYYRDGRDTIGWHSDDEASLGAQPRIASLSLGASRTFQLRERRGGTTLRIELAAGALLLMRGESQRRWRHRLPPSRTAGARINISFRHFVGTSR